MARTYVNVESVHSQRENAYMTDRITIGAQLLALKERSKLSLDKIASRAKYGGRSSLQRYFSADYDVDYLPRSIAERLADALEGDEVSREDVLALAGIPAPNAVAVKLEGGADVTLPRDVEVYGTALGAPREFDGQAIEQTTLNTGEIITYIPRPPALNGIKAAYALYVQGSSMSPRFEDGETIFVTDSRQHRPARITDDVVVYLRCDEEDDGSTSTGVMVKRLARRTAHFVELQQFNPPVTFKVPMERILRVDRVVPWAEIFS